MNNKEKQDEIILYWAKQLEHKSLSVHELVENANFLLSKIDALKPQNKIK